MTIVTLDESLNKDPAFDVEKVQLQFDLNRSLSQLLVQNNVMYLILSSSIFKINLSNPSIVKHVEVPRDTSTGSGGSVRIVSSWLHWNGMHLIVQTNHHQFYYLHDSYQQFKVLPRFKGLNVKYLTFKRNSATESDEKEDLHTNTGDFLFGTKEGAIYVSSIKSHEIKYHESKRDDKYVKSVYPGSGTGSLTGLAYVSNSEVLAVVDGDLVQWSIANNTYNDIVKAFRQIPTRIDSVSATSESSSPGRLISDGRSYLFLNGTSIRSSDAEFVRENLNLPDSSAQLSSVAHGAIMTKYHTLALIGKHNEKLGAFMMLSNKPGILVDDIGSGEKILGITSDNSANTFWLYTNNNIFEVIINNESGSVWYYYYQMGKYEEALRCLQELEKEEGDGTADEASFSAKIKKDLVLIEQGYSFLSQGGFGIDYDTSTINEDLFEVQKKGIRILARSSEPFEKVSLMLMTSFQHQYSAKTEGEEESSDELRNGHNNTGGFVGTSERLLVEYLLVKFSLAKKERNKVRIVVLSTWIVELLLRMMYRTESDNGKNNEKDPNSVQAIFHTFLTENYKILDPQTIYQVITGFNYPSKLIYFAELIQDYEFILNYNIEREDWANSLRILIKIYTLDDEKMMNVIYKKATILLANAPKETISTWLKFPSLDYERLLPALLTYNKYIRDSTPISENQSVIFLQKVIYEKGVKNEVINNYYLSLLISYPFGDEKSKLVASKAVIKLLNKIHEINSTASSRSSPLFDSNYILRQCLSHSHYHPAILILINDMRLFEQALRLALDNNLTELGLLVLKRYDNYLFNIDPDSSGTADVVGDIEEDLRFVGKIKLEEESFSSRKKLWIMFSRYLIEGVCQGKEYEFLDDIDLPLEEPNKSQAKGPKENAAKSLIADMTGNSSSQLPEKAEADLQSFETIRKLIKYLLYSSNIPQTNSNILSLKDILPLFPSTIMISNFKTEIIQSLNQYNHKIAQLSHDMQESLQISTNLKKQIKESTTVSERAKIYTIIEPGEPCGICRELLIAKSFVCFPNCNHGFHKECLVKFYLKSKGEYKFKKIFEDFKRQASSVNRAELDEILLKECVLCNESNINTIDDIIVDVDRERAEVNNWEL